MHIYTFFVNNIIGDNMRKIKADYYLLVLLFIMFIVSLLSLYNADLINGNVDNILIKQLVWYLIGFAFIFIILYINNDLFIKYSLYFYILCNILLLLLLLFAPTINGAKCWFKIKGLGTIQISEFTKIAIILFSAFLIPKINDRNELKKDIKLLIYTLLIFIFPAILTFLEPDTGAVLMYLVIIFFILFTNKLRLRWYIFLISTILIFASVSIFLYFNNLDLFLKLYGSDFFLRVERITNWINKDGMQLNNGITAIGIGGLFGSKLDIYFPEAHTDFIFAVFASKFGFIGSLSLLLVILLFDLRILHIYNQTRKKENKIIIIGILSVILYQQIQNIGMTFGLLPITGITLPFISYGGSSLISYMIMIGIILNINNDNKKRRSIYRLI